MKKKSKLTAHEERAIQDLKMLALRWPSSLKLFSWSGSLHVLKPGQGRNYKESNVDTIKGIPNDGGDPNWSDQA